MVDAGKYVRIILNPNLVTFSCIGRSWWMTHKYGNSGNDVVICRVGNIPEHGTSLHFKVDIWHPAVGLTCGNPPRHLNQLKTWAISLIETPSGQELCRSWYIVHDIFIGTHPPQNKIQISMLIFDTLLWAWGAETNPGT